MWQSVKVLNVFNTLTLIQIFWKTKTFFKKLKYSFLVETTKIENTLFSFKTALSDANVKTNRMAIKKCIYHKEWSFASNCFVFWKFVSVLEPLQCQTQSIFGDTVYLCYCEFRLVTLPWWGLRGQKLLILTTLDCWERHFREQNYIENYFYFIKSTKSTKSTPQKCWRNIIWADFFWHPYWSNGIKTHLSLQVLLKRVNLMYQQPKCPYLYFL